MRQRLRNALFGTAVWLVLCPACWAQFGGGAPAPPPAIDAGEFGGLLRVVHTTVAPDSWDQVGGPGTAQAIDTWGILVVSQTQDVHHDLENLLSTIRQVRRAQKGNPGGAEAGAGLGTDDAATPQAPPRPVSYAVESEANQQARLHIEGALASATVMEFVDTPLSDIVQYLAQTHEIPIVIDTRSLEDAGIGADTPLTRNLRQISLRSGLQLLLNEVDLTFAIQDEVLLITTPEAAESKLVTRIYPVDDLRSE